MPSMIATTIVDSDGAQRRTVLKSKIEDSKADSSTHSGLASVILLGDQANQTAPKRQPQAVMLPKYGVPRQAATGVVGNRPQALSMQRVRSTAKLGVSPEQKHKRDRAIQQAQLFSDLRDQYRTGE